MSCKIERLVTLEDLVVLRVSGRIDGANVDILREMIGLEPGVVTLDLTEVRLVDREAVRLLVVSEANGIEFINCPAYIREWVAQERDSAGARHPDPEGRRST
jgi:anti-anti-sigma regulatory factor